MESNNTDRFVGSKDSEPANISSQPNFSGNFFIEEENRGPLYFVDTPRRINDYDSNLLQEDAYKDIGDELFKLEYKISKTEDEINSIQAQIQTAKDVNDVQTVENLTKTLQVLQVDYERMLETYKEKSISARITGKVSNLFSKNIQRKTNPMANLINNFSEKIMEKMPKQFVKLSKLRKSLDRLENLSKSVDELVNMNSPYGEDTDRYRRLSNYIIKANNIQSEISKTWK